MLWSIAVMAMSLPGVLPEAEVSPPDTDSASAYSNEVTITESGDHDAFFDLVTTFSGDPHTSRAFAWEAEPVYTDMVIQYGTEGSEYIYQLKAKCEKYPVAYAKNDTPNVEQSIVDAETVRPERDMLFYRVSVKGLEPGKEYVYRIGDTEKNVWSGFYKFTTEPENTKRFSVIAVTDPQGRTPEEYEYYTKTLDNALLERPEAAFIINMGDFTDNGNYDDWWRYFFEASAGVKERLPLMTAIGNHENRGYGAKYYNLHFFNPENAAGLGRWYKPRENEEKALPIIKNLDNTVYSFDYGNAHFAVVNTGTDWEPESMRQLLEMQRIWLECDLATTNKQWKILMAHIGVYVEKPRENLCREVFGKTIDKYGVDLVLEGHDHIYMRTWQMKGGERMSDELKKYKRGKGTIYSIIGSAAQKRYESNEGHPWTAVLRSVPEKTPSYTLLDFDKDSLCFTEKLTDGTVIDEFKIKR